MSLHYALPIFDDGASQSHINCHAVMSFARCKEEEVDENHVALAVAASAVRAEMARKCDEAGLPLLSVWAKDVIVMDDVELADGALVSPYVTFTSNIKVGRRFHDNLYSYVEHDGVIGDYVHFSTWVQTGSARDWDRGCQYG